MTGFRENDSPGSHEARLSELGQEFAAALLAADEVAAEIAIREAMDARLTTAEIDDEIAVRVLALQREAQRVARVRAQQRVMLATPAGELHVVALRMVANLLRDAGYHVVMLGPDVPPDALARSAQRHEADVICLSTTMAGGGDHVLNAIHEVQRAWPRASFVLGGRGLTSRLRSRPGVDVCKRVSEVVEAVDALVQRADSN